MIIINLKKKSSLKKNCIIKVISGNKKGFIGVIKMLNFKKHLLGICAADLIEDLDNTNNSKLINTEKKNLMDEKVFFNKLETTNFRLSLKKKLDKLFNNSLNMGSFFLVKYSNVMLWNNKANTQEKLKSSIIDGIKIKTFKKSGSIQRTFSNYFKT